MCVNVYIYVIPTACLRCAHILYLEPPSLTSYEMCYSHFLWSCLKGRVGVTLSYVTVPHPTLSACVTALLLPVYTSILAGSPFWVLIISKTFDILSIQKPFYIYLAFPNLSAYLAFQTFLHISIFKPIFILSISKFYAFSASPNSTWHPKPVLHTKHLQAFLHTCHLQTYLQTKHLPAFCIRSTH